MDKDQYKDTDKDGLSDYNELNLYCTSPYIADSDSDGIMDGAEVKAGTDPNCPVGKTCQEIVAKPEPVNPLAPVQQGIPALSGGTSELLNKIQSGATPSAAEIRAMLQQTGQMKPEILNQLTDQELVETWQQTMGAGKSETQLPNYPITQLPSVSEIRQFLKTQGMTDEMLKNFTDQQLLQIFQESLKGVK